ncbi:MAG: response regulator [Actinomycetota bacterium]
MTAPAIRVLLLEDDPADARLVVHLLRRVRGAAFQVSTVSRLAQALDAIAAGSVDVVLADLNVPDSTGMATVRTLAQAAPALPLVVLTGNDDDDLALDALKHGAQDYLVKSRGDGPMLARVIRYAIERKSTELVLKDAVGKAEAAARAKSVFLAMVGHEIRTPLNGILGMARMLLETPLAGSQRTYAETVLSSGELLLGLVEDILDFSRLDAGGLTLETVPFDVLATVEEVRLVLSARAAEKGLALTLRVDPSVEPVVSGDPLRLRQVLFNLVGNAIKFTDAGGVAIAVDQLAADPQVLRFTITDTGIGIPEDARAHLFAEFWQGEDAAYRRYGGAGLGLAICRRLVRLMGGQIDYESERGHGSVFQVDLLLPAAPAGTVQFGAVDDGPPRRVLLVDDDPVNREVAAGLLQLRGHTVVAVADGETALAAVEGGGFDLVLLDLVMPGMDGIETARAIRALPAPNGAVPIHLLTANAEAAAEAGWRGARIDGLLRKPLRLEQVGRVLAGLEAGAVPGAAGLVDRAGLAEDMAALGRERMDGLVRLLRTSSAADRDAALAHAAAGRANDLAAVVHRMASAAASVHLAALAEHCRRAEGLARAGECAGVAGLAELWETSLAALEAAVAADDQPATSR